MVRRVSVVGNSGSGKTTVAAQLAARLGVSHIELDAIRHQPNWQELPDDEFRSRVAALTDADGWVVDGNYGAVRDLVVVPRRHRRVARPPASRRRPADRDAFPRPGDGAA